MDTSPCKDCRGVCKGAQHCPNLIDEDFKKLAPVKAEPDFPVTGDTDGPYRVWNPYTQQYDERSW